MSSIRGEKLGTFGGFGDHDDSLLCVRSRSWLGGQHTLAASMRTPSSSAVPSPEFLLVQAR